jgi:general nucleoside transport system permease protein
MTTQNRSLRILRPRRLLRVLDAWPIIMALLVALLVASVLLISLDKSPVTAVSAMLEGAVGTENATAETLVKAIPIMFVAIGICVAFRGGVINIGGEGQMIVGALAGTAMTLQLDAAPTIVIIAMALLTGFIAGALYGGLAGFLKAYFGVNEILSTIMLNQIAVQMMNYLLNGIMLDPEAAGVNNIPKTARIADHAELPRLWIQVPEFFVDLGMVGDPDVFFRTRLHYGLIVALFLGALTYVLLWRTTVGYRIRAVGLNERAARYAGINVRRQIVFSMLLAGGFAGLAGVVQVLGLQYRLQTDGSPTGFTGNAGFNGIVAALFGGLNPLGAIPASAFFGGLLVGAQRMQRELGVSASLITAINGMIVVFVVSSQLFVRRQTRRRVNASVVEKPVLAKEGTGD